MQSVKSIAVHYNELADLYEKHEYVEHNSDVLSKENVELQTRCEKFYNKLQNYLEAKQESEQELENIQNEYDKLLNQNRYLKDYREKTGLAMDLCNTGKFF
jgi:chromosome segregation ATPase